MLHGKPEKDWAQSAVFYQIYPMGFCGAPFENDGVAVNRIQKVKEWIPHLEKLGIGAIYFSPVFQSDTHGYDTRDFKKIDCRLGTNQEFKEVCDALHQAGIRVVLDGVFNHVGRGFWAFQDVKEKREASPYKDWFHINFGGNSGYNDGFWYEGWEGHYELVKLNLQNPAVVDYLLDCVGGWMEEFSIDGLRLAAVNTPSMLTTPLSVIAGIVLGEYSVQSGWFNSETMLYMAFVTIANYSQASFELGDALKFMRVILLLLTSLFNLWGFLAGLLFTVCAIVFNKTIAGKSYIYPLIPFSWSECKKRFLRGRLPHTRV